ncbi:maleylpyruvate isomerase family mycothiol-dependent enzyme [Actinoplanes missouriensis]|uniref:maleylpyruvate isomerase family mycothiol-dependent enzyme n=1 Tax=Actinoplanes missouriensis TaxID=1866 RepID=UPI0033E6FFB3
MNVWDEIIALRHAVADLLDDLTAEEWDRPSLCAGWTVRDVAAHLTQQQMGLRDVAGLITGWQGGMDATIAAAARKRAAAWSPEQIIQDIRSTAERRRHNLGVTPMETLADLLVHGQDMAVPLSRDFPMPPDAAAAALTRGLTMRMPPPLPAVRALRGLRLVATDVEWAHGDGPELRGPIGALLLTSCGRMVWSSQLSGDGLGILHGRGVL